MNPLSPIPPPPPPPPVPDFIHPGAWYECDDRIEQFLRFLDTLDWLAGTTKHTQTFDSFLRAASLGVDPRVARDEVVNHIAAVGGVLDLLQIARQQQRAIEFVTGQSAATALAVPKSPRAIFLPETFSRVAAAVNIISPSETLRAISLIAPTNVTAASFLQSIYELEEHVLIFTEYKSQGQNLHRVGSGEFIPDGGIDGVWFLVQPINGQFHPNPRQGGKMSRRSAESVVAWRYLVLESDHADTGDWIRVLVQLPLRIVAIYTSGGRSIHALVRIDAPSKAAWDDFKNGIKAVVVTLGADPGALSAVRLSRLPQCWRGDRRQELLYLNPDAGGTPIINLCRPDAERSEAVNTSKEASA